MEALVRFAADGRRVLGICNGFQVLCESGLLPGALVRNNHMKFVCQDQPLQVEDSDAQFNSAKLGSSLTVPIAHGEGNFRIDEPGWSNFGEIDKFFCATQVTRGTPTVHWLTSQAYATPMAMFSA